jgi:hypothetical protein
MLGSVVDKAKNYGKEKAKDYSKKTVGDIQDKLSKYM